MNNDKNFFIILAVCTIICIIILSLLMYNFIQILVTGF